MGDCPHKWLHDFAVWVEQRADVFSIRLSLDENTEAP